LSESKNSINLPRAIAAPIFRPAAAPRLEVCSRILIKILLEHALNVAFSWLLIGLLKTNIISNSVKSDLSKEFTQINACSELLKTGTTTDTDTDFGLITDSNKYNSIVKPNACTQG
jgi:hypothetical protein